MMYVECYWTIKRLYTHIHVQGHNSPNTIWFIDKTEVSHTSQANSYIQGKKRHCHLYDHFLTHYGCQAHTHFIIILESWSSPLMLSVTSPCFTAISLTLINEVISKSNFPQQRNDNCREMWHTWRKTWSPLLRKPKIWSTSQRNTIIDKTSLNHNDFWQYIDQLNVVLYPLHFFL